MNTGTMNSLEEIALLVKDCTDCPLGTGRTNAVPGEGPLDAKLMFIGEGPGYQEDRQGRPFVGPAGQFLEELLASIGMTRRQVFIANMIKCRPPENRDPSPAEMSSCSKYLDRQIELVNPASSTPSLSTTISFTRSYTVGKLSSPFWRSLAGSNFPRFQPVHHRS